MSDLPPPPPGGVPYPPTPGGAPPPPGGPPAPPPPGSAPVPGAYGTAPPGPPDQPITAPPARRRPPWLDFKSVIAIMIGVVSVTGAVITWRSSLLAEEATDNDRQAIVETVQQQQSQAAAETRLRSEQDAFARYKADKTNAARLRDDAAALRAEGLVAEAQAAENEANELDQVADTLATLTFNVALYVELDENGLPVSFNERLRRADLERETANPLRPSPDPGQTADAADDLRDRSQRLVGFIVVLVAAVVALSLAQMSRRRPLRVVLAGAGVGVYVVATALALFGPGA